MTEDGKVKLGDFGLSRKLGEQSVFAKTNVGTPYYMAPELYDKDTYNEKIDIWALGCIVFEMANLTQPFKASNILQLAKTIKEKKTPALNPGFSKNLQMILNAML